MRGADVGELAAWQVDQFSGASIQRPQFRAEAPVPVVAVAPEPMPVETPHAVEPAEPDEASQMEAARQALQAERQAARAEGYQAGHDEGWREGYASGEAAGREAGLATGLAQGIEQGRAEAAADVARFAELLHALESAVQGYEAILAKPIADLALAIASQIIRTSLRHDPNSVQRVVREALDGIPELRGPLRLQMHPDDVALLQAMFENEPEAGQWRFDADPHIDRGGCIISNAMVDVDLTLPTRWQRVVASLGLEQAWAADDLAQ
ncbi:flagellar assembly protein FliH [Chitinimonas sp.]|uniref:flagellar assembly protein FliH n=1 Tax=Chitinimonas sp. TaxID=1934313 RepID=UPI0035ADD2E4